MSNTIKDYVSRLATDYQEQPEQKEPQLYGWLLLKPERAGCLDGIRLFFLSILNKPRNGFAFLLNYYKELSMTKATATAIKMLESLPEDTQEQVVEKLSEVVEDFRDEAKWAKLFEHGKKGFLKAAKKAREEIDAGKAVETDYDKL